MKRIFNMTLLIIMSTSINAQGWLDTMAYPFTSYYFDLPKGKMHYVDEGKGDVILFVHGTPTWSFLYRDMIKIFSKTHRCIAVDHLGFGLSDKPGDFEGTPEAHAENLNLLIEELDLRDFTLVVHDFGGPIGLGAAIQNPDRIKQVVLFNSWLWSTKAEKEVQKIDRILNSWLGKLMYLQLNFSPKVLLKQGFADKKRLTREIHQQYIRPFPNKQSRVGLLKLGQSLMGSSDWYEQQWQLLDGLAQKPWLILWGTRDKFITPDYLDKWKNRLGHYEAHELDCGHFIQEERIDDVIRLMEGFLLHRYHRDLTVEDCALD